jgi:bacterioferritin-associated ferredoxin
MYMCLCRDLTESGVRGVVQDLAQSGVSSEDVLAEETMIEALGLDGNDCCGQCAREIDRFIDLASNEWFRLAVVTR